MLRYPQAVTPEETAQLAALLKKLPEQNLRSPHMPFEVWKAIQAVVPVPAVEVIITRNGKDFLLVNRKDEHWDGWHIPGGYMLYQEPIPDACARIADKELGIKITFDRLIDAFMWPDHPYSSALSVVCVCTTKDEPKAGEFFTEIPQKMIPHHGDFLKTFLSGR